MVIIYIMRNIMSRMCIKALMKRTSGSVSYSQLRYFRCHARQQNKNWCEGDQNSNPMSDLESLVEDPGLVLPRSELPFSPDTEEISKVQSLFKLREKKESSRPIYQLEDLPDLNLPEVCFIGRSNVGKSSLIKAIFHIQPSKTHHQGHKIRVSKTPGSTKGLHFYTIGHNQGCLVDMPGYGHNMPEHYIETVEQYIPSRPMLQRVFLLIDAQRGLQKNDLIGIEMLEEFAKPYTLVLTKIDKAGQAHVLRNLLILQQYRRENMPSCFPQPFLVSSHEGFGIPLLRAYIAYVLGLSSFSGL